MTNSEVSDRIGFRESKVERLPNNRCRARVVLAWSEGDEFVGTAQGEDTETGRLWCAAEATVRALELSVDREIELKVVGVRTLPEPDTLITVTRLSGRFQGEAQQLIGSCIGAGQLGRSAALSVLKATNRLLGKDLHPIRLSSSLAPGQSAPIVTLQPVSSEQDRRKKADM